MVLCDSGRISNLRAEFLGYSIGAFMMYDLCWLNRLGCTPYFDRAIWRTVQFGKLWRTSHRNSPELAVIISFPFAVISIQFIALPCDALGLLINGFP